MSKNTQIVLFSNIAILIILHLLHYPDEKRLFLQPLVFWMLFNIAAGIIIFFFDKALGKAFFLLGITSLLIGGSFCGLGIILWKNMAK